LSKESANIFEEALKPPKNAARLQNLESRTLEILLHPKRVLIANGTTKKTNPKQTLNQTHQWTPLYKHKILFPKRGIADVHITQ
jgi:hypothetical protein